MFVTFFDSSLPNSGTRIKPTHTVNCTRVSGTTVNRSLKIGIYMTASNTHSDKPIDIFKNLFEKRLRPNPVKLSDFAAYDRSNSAATKVKKHMLMAVA